jgi:hypothetical protein
LLGYVGAIVAQVSIGGPGGVLFRLVGMGLSLAGIFTMRSDIEEYYAMLNPVGLNLSAVMTFFFSAAYFQYHLQEMRETAETALSTAAG